MRNLIIFLLVCGSLGVAVSGGKCTIAKLNCKSKKSFETMLKYMNMGQDPNDALTGCSKNGIKMAYPQSNKYLIKVAETATFDSFKAKRLCFQTKFVKAVQITYELAEVTQFGPATETKFVHVTDTEDDKWRKSCFKTDLFISWIKLENLPADNHVDDMHIRRVIMKACTE